jgi:hypothetical protein
MNQTICHENNCNELFCSGDHWFCQKHRDEFNATIKSKQKKTNTIANERSSLY